MRARRVLCGNYYIYTSDWRRYLGILLCNLGFHKKRIRKNGKRYEYVCKREYCEYCEKIDRCKE